ncbi:hypothetical protein [Flavobacterium sp.]|uniref:hypothetical protein n=1 Tax=Flavobacterium sp. TaxID=239 RepID=UPI002633B219|nr:hypothetical protein [Flavobacterium sp.]
MKYLLFSGAPGTGKTGSIARLADMLIITKRFRVVSGHYPPIVPQKDFRVILEGLDNRKNLIRIYLNSATDTKKIIKDCKAFYDANQPVDIIVSSIRDVFSVRTDFFAIMKVNNATDYLLELPLGKVRRGTHRTLCLVWYEQKLDILVKHILESNPFNL